MNKGVEYRRYGKSITMIKTKISNKAMLCFVLFLVLNSIKLTLFNFSIMHFHSVEVFLFKFALSLFLAVIMYTVAFRFKSYLIFILFYIVQDIYIFSNISYFSYFRSYLHLFQSAALFTEGVGSIKHFTIPVNYRHMVMLTDLPVFIYLLRNYLEVHFINTRISKYFRFVIIGLVFLVFGNEAWHYSNNNSILSLAKDYALGEPVIVQRYGTVVNNLCDVIFNFGGKNLMSHIKYGKRISNAVLINEPPNIIAIQVESMDSNIINARHKGEYVMPYLQTLTKESVYYPYVLSYHKAGGTSDSEFAIINSVEPLGNYPSIKLSKYEYPNSMLSRLSGNYNTFAFHGNIGNYYNRDVAFPKMGFKNFDDIRKMEFKDVGWGAPDHDVYDYVVNKLSGSEEPFFSYIITLTSHTPFSSARNYYNNNAYDDVKDERVKNFFNSFSYVDETIKNFVAEIKRKFPNTYIFIWGDHAPDIDTEEYKQAAYLEGSSYFEYVPLVIITPDNKKHIESEEVASFLDFAPTMLKLSGIPFSIESDGKNLLEPSEQGRRIPFCGLEYDRKELFKRIADGE